MAWLAVELLPEGTSKLAGSSERDSGIPCARAAPGTEHAWPAAETQETELVKLGKEVESYFKFI